MSLMQNAVCCIPFSVYGSGRAHAFVFVLESFSWLFLAFH